MTLVWKPKRPRPRSPTTRTRKAEGEPARCRKRNGQADHATLLEAVTGKVEEVGGWDFNSTALYRELEAKGVNARNFCSWVTKHRAAVEAILDQRRADRDEG